MNHCKGIISSGPKIGQVCGKICFGSNVCNRHIAQRALYPYTPPIITVNQTSSSMDTKHSLSIPTVVVKEPIPTVVVKEPILQQDEPNKFGDHSMVNDEKEIIELPLTKTEQSEQNIKKKRIAMAAGLKIDTKNINPNKFGDHSMVDEDGDENHSMVNSEPDSADLQLLEIDAKSKVEMLYETTPDLNQKVPMESKSEDTTWVEFHAKVSRIIMAEGNNYLINSGFNCLCGFVEHFGMLMKLKVGGYQKMMTEDPKLKRLLPVISAKYCNFTNMITPEMQFLGLMSFGVIKLHLMNSNIEASKKKALESQTVNPAIKIEPQQSQQVQSSPKNNSKRCDQTNIPNTEEPKQSQQSNIEESVNKSWDSISKRIG